MSLDPKLGRDLFDAATKLPDLVKTGREAKSQPVAFIVLVVGIAVTYGVLVLTKVPDGEPFWLGFVTMGITIAVAVWAQMKADGL